LVINAGDLIQRWTNDRWRSNVHRVVNPPRALTGSTRRLSIVCFTGPSADTEIACIPSCIPAGETAKYAPIIAGDHLKEKVRLTSGTA
jgi:isopenicillin N synthase-like dioxygenase